ncbi:MAG: HNH endonuclease [Acidobacteriota bacterium]
MIRLQRGPAHGRLNMHSAAWTARWRAIHGGTQNGDWATPTAKELLSTELRRLSRGKCAYCEGLLGVTSYLEIEHYIAKTVKPDLAFDWNNLLPVCRLCNGKKSNIDHKGLLLKPDRDDPESVLWLNPDSGELETRVGVAPALRRRVERTIELCDLQRGLLCTKRIEVMNKTIRWLERVSALGGGPLDRKLRDEWAELSNPHSEYKFVIRHVLEIKGEPRLASYDRVQFEFFTG